MLVARRALLEKARLGTLQDVAKQDFAGRNGKGDAALSAARCGQKPLARQQ
ncbi:hypothetical protein D3C80_2100700 [compost metagenome]